MPRLLVSAVYLLVLAFSCLPASSATPTSFVPIQNPCRVIDTRVESARGFGSPILGAASTRNFKILDGGCGIPSGAASAYALNVTVVPSKALGFLTVWPTGLSQPNTSTLNSDGRVKAVAAIVPAGTDGAISIFSSDETHVVIDINGYFTPTGVTGGLLFYPVTPCRVSDTRNTIGSNIASKLQGNETRPIFVANSPCGIPLSAQAYSLNFTAIPDAVLGFLSSWPFGQSQPPVSTLNAANSNVTANAAIIPAGTEGKINVYASHPTHLAIDINGYFAAPATGGLSFYATSPCRALDTRSSGTYVKGIANNLPFAVGGAGCQLPASAKAFVLNATVVPVQPLRFLSLWPADQPQPVVSTLNAADGAVTSNLAIVSDTQGAINIFATDATQLILDVSGYFL